MISKMNEIFKKVLNDRDIFWMRELIFNEKEWAELKKVIDNPDNFIKIVDNKIESIKSNDKNKKDIEESTKLCEGLKSAIRETPNLLNQIFDVLKSFGVVRCNLPNMDDYGKVVERYGMSTVEQFFLDKIRRENSQYKKKAMVKVLEYVKELHNSNLSSEQIAYFVRKLDSLKTFWEV